MAEHSRNKEVTSAGNTILNPKVVTTIKPAFRRGTMELRNTIFSIAQLPPLSPRTQSQYMLIDPAIMQEGETKKKTHIEM